MHHSRRPILVARGGQRAWPPERVVVGDDGSEMARQAAEFAAGIAKPFGSSGVLVCAYPEESPRSTRKGEAAILAWWMTR